MTNKPMEVCSDCNREYLKGKKENHRFLWHNPKINGRKEWFDHDDYGIRDCD